MEIKKLFRNVSFAAMVSAVSGPVLSEGDDLAEMYKAGLHENNDYPMLVIEVPNGRTIEKYHDYLTNHPDVQKLRNDLRGDEDGLKNFDRHIASYARQYASTHTGYDSGRPIIDETIQVDAPLANRRSLDRIGVCIVTEFVDTTRYKNFIKDTPLMQYTKGSDKEYAYAIGLHEEEHCSKIDLHEEVLASETRSDLNIMNSPYVSDEVKLAFRDARNIKLISQGSYNHATTIHLNNPDKITHDDTYAASRTFIEVEHAIKQHLESEKNASNFTNIEKLRTENSLEYVKLAAKVLKDDALSHISNPLIHKYANAFLETYERRYPEFIAGQAAEKTLEKITVKTTDNSPIMTRDGPLLTQKL